MATLTLTPADLVPFASIDPVKAQAMIDDALALAKSVAPCLAGELTDGQAGAAIAIIRGAILRWDEAGPGAVQSQTAGPFGVTLDTKQVRYGMYWPSEITQLKTICKGSTGKAWAVDRAPAPPPVLPCYVINRPEDD